ncbi:hypothetical protein ACFL54_08315 [Planctomycetota bacterium]
MSDKTYLGAHILFGLDQRETLFVAWAFLFQIILIAHFSLRKWSFDFCLEYGWIVYALSVPAVVLSVYLLLGGKEWSFWLGGFIYLTWAVLGYTIEYTLEIKWRNPIYWPIFGPYVLLYLSTVMFYWWPLALIRRPLWFVYALMFIISTILNIISHK